jgi:saposin
MDSYATLLFPKIMEIKPEAFCKQFALCRNTTLFSGVRSESTCVFCHHLFDEIMSKLKDPDVEVIAPRHLRVPHHELPFCV